MKARHCLALVFLSDQKFTHVHFIKNCTGANADKFANKGAQWQSLGGYTMYNRYWIFSNDLDWKLKLSVIRLFNHTDW